MPPWLTVIGIGEDGFAGLSRNARRALLDAEIVTGAPRHLSMLPGRIRARREPWPKPFDVDAVHGWRGRPVCVLASGDPMLFGVGATLARCIPANEMQVIGAPSSLSLAAGRLGWALQDIPAVSLVGRPLAALNAHLREGARLLVLSRDGASPADVAALLCANGFGATSMSVFESLGGPHERRIDATARHWGDRQVEALNLVALTCAADPGAGRALPLTAGLPDDAFVNDGQLTKRDVRAITLSRLAPHPGALLWDVGAGCGSIGIEWMRAHPACHAIAIESSPARQAFIAHNRDALGVPGLTLVAGRAPDALQGLAAPHAIFIGGGVTAPGVLDACWTHLRPGGRLVANAVTLQSEAVLTAWRERHGGTLTRLAISEAQPLGGFDTWRAALPITLLEVVKPATPGEGATS
ncbi:precorrin-6Y C5,15-methyltransferase [Pandoraea faecigallinarum]|uniref:Precorrin-6Y C5,15-methyltransferase n=1 Tax=Pandoraea faecigallinarum TaxID=656179 RepID=A0A0H3WXW4_9BURK|nr:bifunctional cobalt-precorrin-7 (C(5))-methyltransferase/cobalt-precorrin-6B (C(15))-methyltransferase [Pandoraea faecigallinarum]AKM32557.1 precorrin-6Y C5,15-methyltransferase [Pandoraea faecigallinarum]